jgi:hypothetical protein
MSGSTRTVPAALTVIVLPSDDVELGGSDGGVVAAAG